MRFSLKKKKKKKMKRTYLVLILFIALSLFLIYLPGSSLLISQQETYFVESVDASCHVYLDDIKEVVSSVRRVVVFFFSHQESRTITHRLVRCLTKLLWLDEILQLSLSHTHTIKHNRLRQTRKARRSGIRDETIETEGSFV